MKTSADSAAKRRFSTNFLYSLFPEVVCGKRPFIGTIGTAEAANQRAMIAENLLPFYRDEAKGRQIQATRIGNKTRHQDSPVPVKLPEPAKARDARDAAGKAAGVSGSYVDRANDPEALADFREAIKGHEGGDKRSTKAITGYNITSDERVTGTGKAYTLSRLKRETPELFASVVRGEMSANAAAVRAMRAADLMDRVCNKELLQTQNRDHPEIAERVKAGDPQRLFTLIRLSSVSSMPPTRWRSTSRNGGGR